MCRWPSWVPYASGCSDAHAAASQQVIQLSTVNQETFDRYQSIESAEQFVGLLHDIHGDGACGVVVTRPVESPSDAEAILALTNGFCHVCGQLCSASTMVAEIYDPELPPIASHASCCEIRSGLTAAEISVACELGLWIMMDIQMQRPKQPWRCTLESEWVADRGAEAMRLLEGLDSLPPDRPYALNSQSNLIVSLRRMYINDRERPKYLHWGSEVLEWDEHEGWAAYKKRLNMHYDKFKEERKRAKQLRGTTRQSWKPGIWARTDGLCHLCCEAVAFNAGQMDHLAYHSKGGKAAPWNLLPVHGWCNGYRSAYPGSEMIMIFLLGRWLLERCQIWSGDDGWEMGAVAYIVKRKQETVARGKSAKRLN